MPKTSLQWLSAAAFLYAEIAFGVLLCFPFISNARWQKIFHSRLLSLVCQYGNFYFSAFVLILILLFADSVSQAYRYSKYEQSAPDLWNNPQAEIQAHMKLFRAQRNLYISGFSLFMLCCLQRACSYLVQKAKNPCIVYRHLQRVLRRLITLISRQATVEASHEAALKQALGATEQCKVLLDENEKLKKASRAPDEHVDTSDEIKTLKGDLETKTRELKEKEEELKKAHKNLEAMKSQSEGLNKEYDRLVEEYNIVQKKLDIEGEDSKKDH